MASALPHHTLDCKNAWLSPDGRIFPNPGFAHHVRQAKIICADFLHMDPLPDDPHSHLVNAGWAYLRDELNGWHIHRSNRDCSKAPDRLTSKQFAAIFDWHEHHSIDLPSWLAPQPEGEPAFA